MAVHSSLLSLLSRASGRCQPVLPARRVRVSRWPEWTLVSAWYAAASHPSRERAVVLRMLIADLASSTWLHRLWDAARPKVGGCGLSAQECHHELAQAHSCHRVRPRCWRSAKVSPPGPAPEVGERALRSYAPLCFSPKGPTAASGAARSPLAPPLPKPARTMPPESCVGRNPHRPKQSSAGALSLSRFT